MSGYVGGYVEYGYGPIERVVAGADGIDRVWDQADAEARARGEAWMAVVFTAAELGGPTIAVGIGRDFSFLRTDLGDAPGDLDGGEGTAWAYGNQSGVIPAGRGIPNESARGAVRHFIETDGGLPDGIAWLAP